MEAPSTLRVVPFLGFVGFVGFARHEGQACEQHPPPVCLHHGVCISSCLQLSAVRNKTTSPSTFVTSLPCVFLQRNFWSCLVEMLPRILLDMPMNLLVVKATSASVHLPLLLGHESNPYLPPGKEPPDWPLAQLSKPAASSLLPGRTH